MEIDPFRIAHGVPAGDGGRPYKIKPLRNQVLVRLLPLDYQSTGGLILPQGIPLFADGEGKRLPRKAVVLAIGEWRKTKQGLSILPDCQPGQRVLVNEYFGTKLTRNIGEEYRLCRIDDILAVLEETLEAPPTKE